MRSLATILLACFLCLFASAQPEAQPCPEDDCSFRWRAALRQSGMLLGILHAGNSRYYGELRRGPFFRDYVDSVAAYRFSHWDDGGSPISNYVGHPLMGAVAGRIQAQNDPRGARQEFGRSPAYWKSRLRALAWSAAFSAQWELGPFSESSLGNFGKYEYLGRDGRLTNGTGAVDLVVTPLAGTALLIGEDALDKHLVRRLESRSRHPLWLFSVSLLNPTRGAANLLRFKPPWYRDARPTR